MDAEVLCARLPYEAPEDVIRGFMDGRAVKEYMVFKAGYDYEYDYVGNRTREAVVFGCCSACGNQTVYRKCNDGGCGCSKAVSMRARFGLLVEDEENGTEIKHEGDTVVCPHCGETVELLHVSRFGNRDRYTVELGRAAAVVRVGDEAAIVCWEVDQEVYKERCGRITSRPWEAYFVEAYETERRHMKKTRLRRAVGWYNNMGRGISRYNHFEPMKRTDTQMPCPEYAHPTDYRVTDGTLLEKSGLVPYWNAYQGYYADRYLDTWVKHPAVEVLAVHYPCMMGRILSVSTKGKGYYSTQIYGEADCGGMIDFKGRRPNELLRLPVEVYKTWREREAYGFHPGFEEIRLWRKTYEATGERLSVDSLMLNKHMTTHGATIWLVSAYDVDHIAAEGIKVSRVIAYMDKQVSNCTGPCMILRDLFDTWDMLRARGALGDDTRFPRNLRLAHDAEVKRVEKKSVSEYNQMIHARFADLSRFSFDDRETGLCIRPAASADQLRAEGRTLHHCVGTYAKQMAAGKTAIFFIRKRSARQTPYFTLELDVKTLKVMQNRGLRNCERSEDVVAFEEKWLAYIRGKYGRKQNKNQKQEEDRHAG